MELFNALTSGIFKFRRNTLLETVDQTKLNLDELVIPSLHQVQSSFALFETKGRFYVKLMNLFYERTEVRKSSDWLNDWLSLMQTARQNLNFVEDQIKKTMENETYSDGISIQKAQLVNAMAALEFISVNTMGILNLLVVSAQETEDNKHSVSAAFYGEAERKAKRIFSLLASHGQSAGVYQKLFKEIPSAILTPSNKDQVLASWGKSADPFKDMERSGFVPNIPLLIVDSIASLRLWKYNRDKHIKKQMEQRIMYLQTRKEGENTASIEKSIKSYENEVEKLQDKIQNFEQEYGG